MMPPMQLITNITKYLALAILSCSLILAWDGSHTEWIYAIPTSVDEGVSEGTASRTVWIEISAALNLDHRVQSTQVQAEIKNLLSNPAKFNSILQAASPYIYYIYHQTRDRGLPAELALIPIIESEFNPNDHSSKGATGLWQLMSATAHELGVKVIGGYDGRRNVIDSTMAALAYFRDLGKNFNGDWYLAIAAYNCGQGRIASALHRTGSQSFWNLSLPKETKINVPKLLAVAAIVKNPEKYGVTLPQVENQPYFTELKVKKAVDLKQVAQKSGISMTTLQRLNPDYKSKAVPKKRGNYVVLVPADKASVVKSQLGVA